MYAAARRRKILVSTNAISASRFLLHIDFIFSSECLDYSLFRRFSALEMLHFISRIFPRLIIFKALYSFGDGVSTFHD